MKNVINPLLLGKLYFINLLTYRMQYLKKFKKFSLKFSIPLWFDIFAIQQNFVIRNIASRLCMLIMILLLKLLCMLEIFFADSY